MGKKRVGRLIIQAGLAGCKSRLKTAAPEYPRICSIPLQGLSLGGRAEREKGAYRHGPMG